MWGVGCLVGVVGFLGSEVVLSPVVSGCLRLSPFMWEVGVVSGCFPSCGGVGGWLVWSASWALKWSCFPVVSRRLRLSPFMWGGGVGLAR